MIKTGAHLFSTVQKNCHMENPSGEDRVDKFHLTSIAY
jgi:hypothetical protein